MIELNLSVKISYYAGNQQLKHRWNLWSWELALDLIVFLCFFNLYLIYIWIDFHFIFIYLLFPFQSAKLLRKIATCFKLVTYLLLINDSTSKDCKTTNYFNLSVTQSLKNSHRCWTGFIIRIFLHPEVIYILCCFLKFCNICFRKIGECEFAFVYWMYCSVVMHGGKNVPLITNLKELL